MLAVTTGSVVAIVGVGACRREQAASPSRGKRPRRRMPWAYAVFREIFFEIWVHGKTRNFEQNLGACSKIWGFQLYGELFAPPKKGFLGQIAIKSKFNGKILRNLGRNLGAFPRNGETKFGEVARERQHNAKWVGLA